MAEEFKKYPSGKKGICVNCRRERYIADKEGLCGSCHAAVDGINPDSLDYAIALGGIKARLESKPERKPAAIKPIPVPKPSAPKQKKPATKKKKDPARVKSSLDMTIKQIGRVGIDAILEMITNERNSHMAEAQKLDKAINLLQSL